MSAGGLTIRGRCLLAAGLAAALCALLLDERDLLRIAVFAVLLPLLAALVAGRTRLGITAGRELVPAQIPAGSSCRVQLTVRPISWAGGGLWLDERLPPALGEAPRFVVERLPRRGEARLPYPLAPAQRGVHRIGPLVARVTDPFGLVESCWEIAGYSRLVVTPVVVPLIGLLSGSGPGRDSGRGSAGSGAHHARVAPGADAVVVRGYRHGDDLRKVHWRSTARHDELMVRMEEPLGRNGTTVLLDHRVSAHRGSGPTSSLEYAVSLAASVCRHLQRHGLPVQLVTVDGRVLAGSAEVALAGLEPTTASELRYGPATAEGQEVIAVLGSTAPAAVAQLIPHQRPGVRHHVVLLDVAAWATPADGNPADGNPADGNPAATAPDPDLTARVLVAAGWSVTMATPEQPVSSVWERLRLNSGSDPSSFQSLSSREPGALR